MRILIPCLALAALCACASQSSPNGDFFGTYNLPSGGTVVAQAQHLDPDTIGLTLRPETMPQRYTLENMELSQELLSTEPAPANAACAPRKAVRIESVFDERINARLSRWRCIA
ncbi:MAG: hypothetical protein JWL84_3945 [Rhodospirillales bacterium]|jgi:hypothetical protein|nr:hypothetical protein [Rhodospirillales bacterium]